MPSSPSQTPRASAPGATSASAPATSFDPVVLEVPGEPTVAFKVWFQVGSQADPPGKEGLAYLTGSLLAEGATTRNSYQQILEKLYPLASSYEVRVDKEMTTLTGRTHRDNLDAFLGLYTDAFLHPAFAQEDFDRLKSNVLNYLEKTLRYASDEDLAKAALHAAVFEGTRYAHPPQGTLSGVRSITLEDVKSFYAAHYTRASAVPAAAGSEPAQVARRLQEAVAALPPGGQRAAPAPAPRAIGGRRVLLVNKPGGDASISFGFPVDVRRGSRDFYALWIANSWLGEHRNSASHLYEVIRELRGLNYGDYSYIEAFPEGGQRSMPPTNVGRRQQIFEVWIRTLPNAQAPFALKAAMRELHDLVEGGLTEEEFQLQREFLSKYILHFAPTPTERLGYAVDDRFYGMEAEGHLSRFRRMMRELTREEVNAALRKHLGAADLQIAIVTGEPDAVRAALVSDQPTPITYASPKSEAIASEDTAIAGFGLGIRAEDIRVVPVEDMFR